MRYPSRSCEEGTFATIHLTIGPAAQFTLASRPVHASSANVPNFAAISRALSFEKPPAFPKPVSRKEKIADFGEAEMSSPCLMQRQDLQSRSAGARSRLATFNGPYAINKLSSHKAQRARLPLIDSDRPYNGDHAATIAFRTSRVGNPLTIGSGIAAWKPPSRSLLSCLSK
jgi:hypothetical protein